MTFNGVGTDITTGTNEDLTLSPNGTGEIILSSLVRIPTLGTTGTTPLCRNASNQISDCSASSGTLQSAYDNGNTILTTTGRNIDFTLGSGLATQTSFTLTNAGTAPAFIINDTVSGSTGSALLVQSGGSTKLTITELGAVSTTGNISTTGTGILSSANGITISAGGANITGGINNNSGGITNTGAIAGATSITASGTVQGANVNATSALQLAGTDINTTGTLSNVAYKGQDNNFTVGQTIGGLLTVTTGGASITGGIDNNTGGITNTGAIAGATSITASGTIQGATINGTSAIQLNGTSINTTGTLTNVAYKGQNNNFTTAQTIGGLLTVSTGGLTVTAGGASINGGLNNNSGGITNAGAISGATNITASGTIQGANVDATTAIQTSGTDRIDASGNLVNIGTIASGAITTTGTLTFNGVGTDITTGTNEDLTLSPNGTGAIVLNTVTKVPTLGSAGATTLCRNASNEISTCSAVAGTLQSAYDTGNTITTTTGRNIDFTLGNSLATQTSFTLTNAGTAPAFIINDIVAGSTGSAILVKSGGVTKLSVDELGNLTSSGSLVTTGTASISAAGTLTSNGFFTANAGANISGGINNNNGGITNAGTIAGAVDITASGTITGDTVNAVTGFTLNGTNINATGTLSNVAYKGQNNNFTVGQTIGGALTVTTGGASITGGINNNTGGITNTGAIAGATNITASGIVTLSGATPLRLTNAAPVLTLATAGVDGTLTLNDGDSNTLLTLTDNGTAGDLSVTGYVNGASLQVGGTNINTTGTLTNVAYKGQNNNFTVGQTIGGALTVTTGGASITGGINNNNGGISNTGAITQATNITASGTIQGATLNATSALQLSGVDINTTGTLSNVAYKGQNNNFTTAQSIAGLLTVSSGGANITGGIDNNTGGITNTGAIAGATTIGASGTVTLSAASPLALTNSAPNVTLGTGNSNATLTIKDTNGSPNTLLTLVDNGTDATLTVANINATGALLYGGTDINATGTLSNVAYKGQNNNFTVGQTIGGALSVTTGGASIVGGIGNNGGNITDAGSITGISYATASGSITAGTLNAVSAIQLNGANINTAGTLNNVAYLNAANVFSNANPVTFSNNTPIVTLSTIGNNGTLTIKDAEGSPNTLLTLVDNGTNGTLTVANINATGALQYNGTDINATGTLSNVAYKGQNNNFTVGQTVAGNLTVSTGGATIFGGINNNGNGIINAGALSGVSTINATGTATLSNATPLVLSNASPAIRLATAGTNGTLTITDSEGSPNTLLTLTDNGNVGTLTVNTINATSALQIGGVDINTDGTLTNVAYKNQNNNFTVGQTIGGLLTVSSGGANITGGIDNNTGGITNTGAITGATSITASGTIQGATLNGTSAIQLNGTNINTTGTLTNVAYKGQNNNFTVGQTIGGLLTVSTGGANITGGIDNNTGGITNTGAIAGATTIGASGLVTLSSASPLTLSNTNPIVTLGTGNANGTLAIKDSAGSPNTLLSLVDNGTVGTLTVNTINGTSALQIGGADINATGTLTNVAYKGQDNLFTVGQTIGGLLTVSTGGANITGGIDNNNGGIINTGSLTQITYATASVSMTAPIINGTSQIQFNGTNINTTGTLTNVAYRGQDNNFTTGQTISGSITTSGASTDLTTASNEDLTLLANGTGVIVLNDLVQVPTLGAAGATSLCRNASNQIATCSAGAGTLQSVYDTGNTITTTVGRNIDFTLGTGLSTSLTLTNDGTATAFVLNDTNAATNTTIDIQSGGVSKLTINENGVLSTSGNISTTGTGTITSAGALTVSGGGASITGGINNNSGGITNTGAIAGASTIAASGAVALSGASPLTLSNTNPIVTLGAANANGTLTIKDSNGTPNTLLTLVDNGSVGTLSTDTINALSQLQINGTDINATGTLTNVAYKGQDNLFTTGQSIAGLLTVSTGGANITGGIDNNNGGIINTGSLTQITYATASVSLTAPIINATTALQLNGTSINTTGTLSNVAYKGQNNNFTSAQTIAGLLTVSSGGASINGGLNNNNGGITNTGAIASATTIGASGTVTLSSASPLSLTNASPNISLATAGVDGVLTIKDAEGSPNTLLTLTDNGTEGTLSVGTINATAALQVGGADINTTGTLSNVAYKGQNNNFTTGQTIGGLLTVSTGGANITGGIDNNTGGITNTGAISGATTIAASSTVTLSASSPLTFSNTTPIITLGAANANGTLTIKDSAGSPNTLLTLVDNGTTGTLTAAIINGSTALQVGGADINTAGTLTNVAYKNQTNNFSAAQTISSGGLTISAGGASVTGGINNNNGGITNAGAITQITYATASSSLTAPVVNATTALQLNGTDINTTGTLSNVAYKGQDNNFTTGQTIGGSVTISGASTDITTASNEDLTLLANGSGEIILNDLVQVPTLGSSGTTIVCRNGSNQLSTCGAGAFNVSLQQAYDTGNTITTTTGRNIDYTLGSSLASQTSFTLTNGGTGNAFVINDIVTGSTGSALLVQQNGSTRLSISELGTLSTSGNISTTGTGTITSAGAITVSGGGASITGGINNNTGGITNTGAIAGASTIDASGTVTLTSASPLTLTNAASTLTVGTAGVDSTLTFKDGDANNLAVLTDNGTSGNLSVTGTVNATSGLLLNGTNINTTNTLTNVAYKGQNNNFTTAQTIGGLLTVSTGGAAITGGINNNSGGITNTGAIAGASTINASGVVTLSGASPLTLSNGTPNITLASTGVNGTLTIKDAEGSPNTLLSLVDNGTVGTLTVDTINALTNLQINGVNVDFSNYALLNAANVFTAQQTISTGGLLIQAGGADITGGINNNAGGITNAGSIAGATSITASGTIQGGTLNGTTAIQLNGTNINTTGTLSNVAYKGQNNNFSTAQTIGGLLTVSSGGITVSAGGANISGGINNNSGGITNTGAIAGASTIDASGTVTLTSASPLTLTNAASTLTVGTAGVDSALTFADGDANTLMTLTDAGTVGNLSVTGSVNATTSLQIGGTSINTTGTLSNVAYKGQNNNFTAAQSIAGLLTVSSGGASITGGLNNNTGNITNAGSIAGATTINASGTVTLSNASPLILSASTENITLATAGTNGVLTIKDAEGSPNTLLTLTDNGTNGTLSVATINASTALQVGGADINTTGTLTNVAYKGQNNNFSVGQTIGGLLTVSTGGLTVSAGGANITGGINNQTGGITNAGAISGATTIGASGLATLSSATPLTLSNVSPIITLATVGNNGTLTINDAEGSPNTLLTLVDNGTDGTLTTGSVNATSALQVGGTNINTTGTLTNVAYKGQNNNFTTAQTIGGLLTVSTGGLTVSAGGANITGGIDNNTGGITNAGTISGATGITSSGSIVLTGLGTSGTLSNQICIDGSNNLYKCGGLQTSYDLGNTITTTTARNIAFTLAGSLGTPTSFTITNAGTATGIVYNDTAAGTTGTPFQIQSATTPTLTISELGAISLTGGSSNALTTLTGGADLNIQPLVNSTISGTGGALVLQAGNESGATSTGGSVTIDAGTGTNTNGNGTLSLGTTNAQSISIGRTGKTTTNNGALTSTQTLTASNGFTQTTGALSLTSTSGSINSTGLTTATITSAGTFALNGGPLNLNTTSGNTAIGNNSSGASISYTSGANATQTFTSSNTTTTGVNSAFYFNTPNLNSGNSIYVTSAAITTGSLLTLDTGTNNTFSSGTVESISSTSQGGAASGNSFLLDLSRSGTNSNSSHTAYGIRSQVTNTGTTSNNIAGYFSASGATNNYAFLVPTAGGNVGIGTLAPTEKLVIGEGHNFGGNLPAPGALTFQTGAGSLTANTYYYKVTALDVLGNETGPSPENSQAVGGSSSIRINWTAVPGASSYRVYRGTSSNGQNTYFSTTANTLLDTGTGGTGGSVPSVNSAFATKFLSTGMGYISNALRVGPTATTAAVLSISGGIGNNGALVVNQINNGDIISASASGVTKFSVSNIGNLLFTGGTNSMTTLTSAATTARTITFPDATGTICISGSTCATSGTVGYFQRVLGALSPANITDDLLIGGSSTSSARFSFANAIGTGTPTLTVGRASSTNGIISFGSSGGGTNPTLSSDSSGNVTLQAPSGTTIIGSGNGTINIVPQSTNSVFVSLAASGATGDFLIQSNGTTFADFFDSGYFTLTSPATLTTGTIQTITKTASSLTGNLTGLGINVSGNTAGASESVGAIDITGFTGGGNTTVNYGLNIGTITGSGSSTNYGINISGATGGSTNNFGLRIQGVSASAVNYGLYVDAAAQNYFAGSVGIGTTAPIFKLDVQDSQAATAAAEIWNTSANNVACGAGGACHTGLIVKLGSAGSSTNPTANDFFINFLQGNGRRRGSISGNGATGVTYNTSGADYAEYFKVDPSVLPVNYTEQDKNTVFATGTLVCQGQNGILPCALATNKNVLGIISGAPAFQGGEEGPDKVIVGLLGQLPLNVSIENGSITNGDPLTTSSVAGVAMKATKGGIIVGHALEDYSGGTVGQIQAYVSSGLADPTEALSHLSVGPLNTLTTDSDLKVNGQITATTASIGSASQFTIDSIGNATTSGSLSFAAGKILSENNNLVNQLAVDINGNNNPTKFAWKNAAGLEIMGLDSNGNATISGTLTTNIGNYDLAEDYPTKDTTLESGDVVSIDTNNDSHIQKSSKAYDNTVLGIYSEKPGFRLSQIGDINGDKAVPVALSGRVPVKVNNENGPIRRGDYLTSSSVQGVAMKATKQGQVLGKALEDFKGTTGKIMTFVNITFADPGNVLSSLGNNNEALLATSHVSAQSIDLPQNLAINGHVINGSLDTALFAISDSISSNSNSISSLQENVLGLSTKASTFDTRLGSLEQHTSSISSQLETAFAITGALNDKVATTSAGIAELNRKIEELLARVNASTSASSTASQSGTATSSSITSTGSNSASYDAVVANLGLTSPDSLISSQSAVIPSIYSTSTAQLTGDASVGTLSINDSLKSFGLSYLGNTTISGDITVSGQAFLNDASVLGEITVGGDSLTISSNAINVKEDTLFLQNTPLSGSINIFNGAVIIEKDGTFKTIGNVDVEGDLNIEGAITITATAGENISVRDALYISASGIVKRADATFADRSNVVGFAANSAARGKTVTVIIGGKAKGFKGLKAGKRYFLKANGGITLDAPLDILNAIPVGIAFTESELLVQLQN